MTDDIQFLYRDLSNRSWSTTEEIRLEQISSDAGLSS